MAIPETQKRNFEALRLAFARNEACMVEGVDKKTGDTVDLICAVSQVATSDGPMIAFQPLAEMSRGDLKDRFVLKETGDDVEDVVPKGA